MLKINNLSKTYKRNGKEALKNISLTVNEGEFTALLGLNGAGKSTLINILAGNVKKTSGTIEIGGYDMEKNELETKHIIGIVPQEISFEYVFTAQEVLQRQSGYFGIKNNRAYIEELLEALSLKEKRNSMVRELSGGMKRRLLIAKALVHRPRILILDEPTAGIDIEMRHSMYEFLKDLHQAGTTIILTTHYIEEAERLCKRVVIIDKGQVIADEPKERLIETFSDEVLVEVHFDSEIHRGDIEFLKEYSPRIEQNTKLYLKVAKSDLKNVFRKVCGSSLEFVNIVVERQKLEDIYLDLIHNEVEKCLPPLQVAGTN